MTNGGVEVTRGSYLIRNGAAITVDPNFGTLPKADILVRDGTIQNIGADLEAGEHRRDARDALRQQESAHHREPDPERQPPVQGRQFAGGGRLCADGINRHVSILMGVYSWRKSVFLEGRLGRTAASSSPQRIDRRAPAIPRQLAHPQHCGGPAGDLQHAEDPLKVLLHGRLRHAELHRELSIRASRAREHEHDLRLPAE